MFDLTIFPLCVEAGREQYDVPGLLVTAAPRKAARMRAQDTLLIYFQCITSTPADGKPGLSLTNAQYHEILTKLADTYFTFSGSVTAGMRAVATRLNDFLLTRNQRAAQDGQTVGILNMAVLHGSTLMIGHAGNGHTFVLAKNNVEHFVDGGEGSPGRVRGLGLSRVAIPRFFQAELQPGDLLVVCNTAPAAWNAHSLANSPQLTFDHLRRRMVTEGGAAFQAAVVRFQAGKGLVSYWRPGEPVSQPRMSQGRTSQAPVEPAAREMEPIKPSAPPPSDQAASSQTVPAADERQGVFLGSHMADGAAVTDAAASPRLPADPVEVSKPAPTPRPPVQSSYARPKDSIATVQSPLPPAGLSTPAGQPRLQPKQKERAAKPARQPRPPAGPRAEGLRRALAQVWKQGEAARSRVSSAFSRAAAGLPKRHDAQGQAIPFFNIPKSAMLAIALVIPLVMAAVASTVYFRAGREQQFQLYYLQAQQAEQQASQQTDPAQQKLAWMRVYDLTKKAEGYQTNDATRAMKVQALTTLDGLDGIVRLNYQPAVSSGFAAGVNITRIVATINDVYLLDSGGGRIFRLYRTSTGYEVDAKFVCGGNATKVGTSQVGPLVDMVSLPPNNARRVNIVGIDTGGNLVLCKAGGDGFDSRLLTAPDSGWGKITAMTASGETLYVLDPKVNGVFRYDPNQDGDYADPPHLYFQNAIPKMADVIDLAVDDEFLYLLHANGNMTVCDSGGFSTNATKCVDPTPYGDSRAGYPNAPLAFDGTQFMQIETTQPPDPSIYALDGKNRSIYHLSLRHLNLQRQYLAQPETDFPLPSGAPTAFTITPNRRALVAFGNQIFFAPIP